MFKFTFKYITGKVETKNFSSYSEGSQYIKEQKNRMMIVKDFSYKKV